MATIVGSGRNAEVHLSAKEFEGFEIFNANRLLGISPNESIRQLRKIGLSNHEIAEVAKAQKLSQEGADIFGNSIAKTGHKLSQIDWDVIKV